MNKKARKIAGLIVSIVLVIGFAYVSCGMNIFSR